MLLAELPDYRNGPYADLRKWLLSEIDDTRVRAGAVHRDSIAVRREGAAQVALVGPPNVGKSSLLQALSEIQIKTGDYPFTTLRPVPALTRIGGVLVQLVEIPGLIDGRLGRPRRRSRTAGRPALGGRDRLLLPGRCRPVRAGRRQGRGRSGRDRQAGPAGGDARRRGRSGGHRPATGGLPGLELVPVSVLDEPSLDAFREATWRLAGLLRVHLRSNGAIDPEPVALRPGATVAEVADCGPSRSRGDVQRRAGVGSVGTVRRAASRARAPGRRRGRRRDPPLKRAAGAQKVVSVRWDPPSAIES